MTKFVLDERVGPVFATGLGTRFQRASDGAVRIEQGGDVVELPKKVLERALRAIGFGPQRSK